MLDKDFLPLSVHAHFFRYRAPYKVRLYCVEFSHERNGAGGKVLLSLPIQV